jgi:hypothetical protein
MPGMPGRSGGHNRLSVDEQRIRGTHSRSIPRRQRPVAIAELDDVAAETD